MRRSGLLSITTPEGVTFSLRPAGPVIRSLAWVIDMGCISVATATVGGILRLGSLVSRDISTALIIVATLVVSVGYGILLEWRWRGQTLGKRLLRLRVMDAEGLRLTFPQVMVRNLLRAVDSLPGAYLVGGAAALLSPKMQRLGDLAAGTVVVAVPDTRPPGGDVLDAGAFNSLREQPQLVARFRREISPGEAGIAFRGVLRREEMAPEARVAFFREVATRFREKVAVPPEVVEGIPDERFVLDVLEIVYRVGERSKRGAGAESRVNETVKRE